ncbi:MAG: hypothetical protein ACI8RD_014474 [Bacillariaceae sp.]|jgi:hypothetical protein
MCGYVYSYGLSLVGHSLVTRVLLLHSRSSSYTPGVPPTTIIQSSYPTKGEIQSTKTTNVCMQTCHQTMDGESYCMVDHWQMANDSTGTGMGDKDSLAKAFGQSGADQIGMLEKYLLSVRNKVNIVSMGNCALTGVEI